MRLAGGTPTKQVYHATSTFFVRMVLESWPCSENKTPPRRVLWIGLPNARPQRGPIGSDRRCLVQTRGPPKYAEMGAALLAWPNAECRHSVSKMSSVSVKTKNSKVIR